MSNSGEKTETDFRELVYRGVESDELDYKAPLNWNTMSRTAKAKIVRHVIALANTRGGFVVIGVGEDASGHPSVYTGLNKDEVHSFDPSVVGAFINRHVEPPVNFTIERPLIDGKRYAVLAVRPFSAMPHVCAYGVEGELQQGVFYIRTSDASSRAAVRAYEMHGLIQRALRNQRELLGRMLRGILYDSNLHETPVSRFEDEAVTTRNYYLHRHPVSKDDTTRTRLEITVFPEEYLEERFSFEELRRCVSRSAEKLSGNILFAPETSGYCTNTAFRIMPEDGSRICQINRSGSLYFSATMPTPERKLEADTLNHFIHEVTSFISSIYSTLQLDEPLEIKVSMTNTDRLILSQNEVKTENPAVCRISEIHCALHRHPSELQKSAPRLFKEISERFNLLSFHEKRK